MNKTQATSRFLQLLHGPACCGYLRVATLLMVLGSMPMGKIAAAEQEMRSVEAEGRAPGDSGNARAEALADAMREAVRVGVGVNVVDQSQVRDFQMDFDRVFTASMGYVKNYKILTSSLALDGIYHVKIKADVGPGTPADNDRNVLKMLAKSRKSPRLKIQLEEKINGQSSSSTATDWFGRLANEIGISIVTDAPPAGGIAAKRAAILKRGTEAELRNSGVVSDCDYILEGTITASSGEPTLVFGSRRLMCSVDVGLRIVDPVSGSVVVSDTLEARRFALEEALSPEIACREAIRRSLQEAPDDSRKQPGMRAFRMLFTHWIAEMDLGSITKVELTSFDLASAEKLQATLSKTDKVGAVWVRSVDESGVSVVDVESSLDGLTLARSICESLDNRYQLDRSDNRYISLRRMVQTPEPIPARSEPRAVAEVSESKAATAASEPKREGAIPYLPIAGGAVGAAALFLLGSYFQSKPKP
jgi:hypothetical protein